MIQGRKPGRTEVMKVKKDKTKQRRKNSGH